MIAFLHDWSGLEKFFLVSAIIGGVFFIIRLVLQFVGGHGGDGAFDGHFDIGNTDVDAGTEVHSGYGEGHVDDTDISFKVLSFQGLTSFFMMFGLVGLALYRQSGWDPAQSIAGATMAGLATVWLLKWIFNAARNLQSSGNIKLENAIGKDGTVYLTIPPKGTGKVQVKVQNHLKIFDAVTEGDLPIKTGQQVQVLRIASGTILVVAPV